MKLLIVLALAFSLTSISAFDLRSEQIYSRQRFLPVVENNGRIANGQKAESGMFPYQVGLSLKAGFLQTSWCGGSLISNEWVLTAAHCTEDIKQVTVYLGGTERKISEVTFIVNQKDIFIHPEWNTDTLLNDISLIKIPSVAFSRNIQPVALPKKSSSYADYAGEYAIASGWGRIGDSATGVAETLQWARMKIITNSLCGKVYNAVTSGNLCLSTSDHVSTCRGDSGGPLVLEATNIQIGLSSFGAIFGCEKGYPVAFTRITEFLLWIESTTGIS